MLAEPIRCERSPDVASIQHGQRQPLVGGTLSIMLDDAVIPGKHWGAIIRPGDHPPIDGRDEHLAQRGTSPGITRFEQGRPETQ